jgi:hydroxymethylpyrimidine/phosphomethylpyrimidine kinase
MPAPSTPAGAAPPIALTMAGSDSSGGAGIQADLKTFSALGVFGASVITALTAQNTRGVTAIHDVPDDFIAAQADAVFTDLDVKAVKIGMLSRPGAIRTVADALARHGARPVVLDPVMVAASGAKLLADAAVETLKEVLIPRCDLLTPNLPEAAVLLGCPMAEDEDDMRRQGEALLRIGARAVLMKGGHGTGPESVDLLVEAAGATRLVAPRHLTRNTHGTGCTLSSAVAAGLAKGDDLGTAVRAAKAYITGAIAAADNLAVGHGHGPVHHFWNLWRP